MGKLWPKYPTDVSDGDEASYAPTKNDRSLLGTERGTDYTRRIETDDNNNLYTRDGKAPIESTVLNNGAVTSVTATTLTTIVTYTAPSAKGVTRISCSGTDYAKYSLVLNTSTIEYKRSGPDRNIEFGPMKLNTNDVLDIKVEHFNTGLTGNFEATIWGV